MDDSELSDEIVTLEEQDWGWGWQRNREWWMVTRQRWEVKVMSTALQNWTSEDYIAMVSQRVKRAASQPGNFSQVQSPRFEKHQSIPVHHELEAKQSTS